MFRSEQSTGMVCFQGRCKPHLRCDYNSVQDTKTIATYKTLLFTIYVTGYITIFTKFAKHTSEFVRGSGQRVIVPEKNKRALAKHMCANAL